MKHDRLNSYRGTVLASVIGLFIPVLSAAGSVVYTYTGQPFTTVAGSVQNGAFLSISLTLSAPLLTSQADQVVLPLAWSISDGVAVDTLTNATTSLIFQGFEFATDTSGNITKWAVGANAGTRSAFSWTANNWSVFGGVTTLDEVYEPTSVSLNQGKPGTWTSASSSTPEPSTILLIFTGTCSLATGRLLILRRTS